MSRYIDADALKQSIDECAICNLCPDRKIFCSYDCDFPDAMTDKWELLINAQPSIDIVRCKECKYKDMELCAMHKLVVAGVRKYDDFCSYGEREGER